MGLQIAELYQRKAQIRNGKSNDLATLHRERDETAFYNYLHDSELARRYASINRILIAESILSHYFSDTFELQSDGKIKYSGLDELDWFETVHNYIDQRYDDIMLRKGAISAHDGERVIIPLNMKDGSLIALGKGNPDWNYSGPHGAGRLMSRTQARRDIKLKDFQQAMAGIYTTTATRATIDEAPFAYKDAKAIIEAIGDTVTIVEHIRPIYNFKAK